MQNLLSDVVVVDLTRALAGPHAAMMLGDLGARVIKVEVPERGDDSRGWGPPFVEGESTYFLSANRNKESVTADLKSDEGKEFLTKLVRKADVLIENFRPGVLDRLGFSTARLHELNPGLVILSITGFGHDGPEGGRAGYDQIAQGEGGLMSITGAVEPTKVGVPIADLLAGMYGAYGALAALHERSITGKGRVVRTSLLASVVGVHAFHGTKWTVADELPERVGNHHAQIAPYGMYRTADDSIQVAVGSEGQWRTFAPIVGLDPEDERFAVNRAAGSASRRADRRDRDRVRRRAGRRVAGTPCGQGDSGRQGPRLPAGLRVGPDPVAGPTDRRRAPDPRHDPAPRPTAALRRPAVRRCPRDQPPTAAAGRAQRVGQSLAGPERSAVSGS